MSNRDEGPVYYREIQKNAYLKRIPNDEGSKLRPLAHKKPPLKAMWTLFCIHNGRTPFLEQYPGAESASTLAHKPTWRACLRAARHVSASVKPRLGDEYDFLVDTDHGPVRMLAPDWDTMQDWVTCLRWKLQELKILPKGENVYCAAPAAPPPRAAARDPTSPLPPTPPVPPDRVPGIELITPVQPTLPAASETTNETETESRSQPEPERVVPETEPVDISSWDTDYSAVPGTSQDTQAQREPKRSVAKICGQNICLDDSILKRAQESTDSDDEFFAEIDRIHDSAENLFVERNQNEQELSFGSSVRNNNEQEISFGSSVRNKNQQELSFASSSRYVSSRDVLNPDRPKDRVNSSKDKIVIDNTSVVCENNFANQNISARDRSVVLDRSISLDNSSLTQNRIRDGGAIENNPTNRGVATDSPRARLLSQDRINNRYERLDEVTSTGNDKKLNSNLERLKLDGAKVEGFKQRLVVNEEKPAALNTADGSPREDVPTNTNITVIQVSNKPPHTAIPVLGPESDVFNFEFNHNRDKAQNSKNFINIVNTEVGVQNDNGYGTVFSNDNDYGHISLTTTLSLTGNDRTTVKSTNVNLPGTEVNLSNRELNLSRTDVNLSKTDVNLPSSSRDFDLGISDNNSSSTSISNKKSTDLFSSGNTTEVKVNLSSTNSKLASDNSRNVKLSNDNLNINKTNTSLSNTNENDGIYERLCLASTSNTNLEQNASPLPVKKLKHLEKPRKSSLPNMDSSESAYEYLYPNTSTQNKPDTANITLNSNLQSNNNNNNTRNITITNTRNNVNNQELSRSNVFNQEVTRTNQESRRNITDNNTRHNERVHVNVTSTVSVGNLDLNARNLRSNVERSHSQNAYDNTPSLREHLIRRVQNHSPKREAKIEKPEQTQAKPIWKRGLTELSLLSRLRGIGQGRRQESPTRNESDRSAAAGKVSRRARPETRGDAARRRSSSLTNGQSPPIPAMQSLPPLQSLQLVPLQSLRSRQAAALRADQRRGAAIAAHVPASEIKVFVDYNRHVWLAWWGPLGARVGGRTGDRVAAVRGVTPKDAAHARQLIKTSPTHMIDILFHRVPLAKIYVITKRDLESIGIKLDNECNITCVESGSPAARAGLPPPGQWALTEVNNRPINLIKGGEEEMNRMSVLGTEVSVLLQPTALIKKIRNALKTHKSALNSR